MNRGGYLLPHRKSVSTTRRLPQAASQRAKISVLLSLRIRRTSIATAEARRISSIASWFFRQNDSI